MTTDETAQSAHKNITDLPFCSATLPSVDQHSASPEPVTPVSAETADFFRTNHLHDLPPAPRHSPPDEAVRSRRSTPPKIAVDRQLVRALQREAAELLREHRTTTYQDSTATKTNNNDLPF